MFPMLDMASFEGMPYTNLHNLNLNAIIRTINELIAEMNTFEAVTKISYKGEWDITKNYPSWSIVVDTTDNDIKGYISIKPVPKGADITDTNYWIMVADLTALYADLGNRLIAVENTLVDVIADINKLFGYNDFSARKVIVISDSYGLTPTPETSWVANLKWYLNIPDANFHSAYHNGSGFLGTQPSYKFVDLFTNLINGWSDDDKDAVTDIIIGGGYNDANATHHGSTFAQVKAAARTCIETMRNHCPNARIYISFLAWDTTGAWHNSLRTTRNIYTQCMNYSKQVCAIDGVNWLHRTALTAADNIHPNTVGATAIAESIASVLLGGTCFCDMAVSETNGYVIPTFASYGADVSNVVLTNGAMLYEGGICTFQWQRITFDLDADIAPNYAVEIGTFDDTIMCGGENFYDGYTAPVRVINNSHYADCCLCIYDNKLILVNLDGVQLDTGTIQILVGSMSGSCML